MPHPPSSPEQQQQQEDRRRTVLITGCTPGGIGHALAKEFHSRGLRVFATARQKPIISDLEELGIETFAVDVTDDKAILALRDDIIARTVLSFSPREDNSTIRRGREGQGGRLDILINNAGKNYTVPASDVDLSEARGVFETNVFSIMRLCQIFLPLLLNNNNPKGSKYNNTEPTTILNIGSLAAVMPYVYGSVYNASKAAVHSYTDTLRLELAPFGIRVLLAVTGGVKSNIARTTRRLSAESMYSSVEEEYLSRQRHSQTVGMDAQDYAKTVVEEVLRPKFEGVGIWRWWGLGVLRWRNEVWEGGKARLVWFVKRFLPRKTLDWAMMRMFGLWKLSESASGRGRESSTSAVARTETERLKGA